MYRRTIAVVDLANGTVTDRSGDTLTYDVPADFDRSACVASVDARSRPYYQSTSGSRLCNPSLPRPLSWRVRGEECLVVASVRGAGDELASRLCAVEVAAP